MSWCRHLLYENGMTRNAVTLDPKGFLGDSFYVSSLNRLVQQQQFDDDACTAHMEMALQQDSSKRPQPKLIDIPASIAARYVFIPTQKFTDVSVQRYSHISYPELLMAALHFCKERRLPLVIKIHPHVRDEERDVQEQLVEQMQRQQHGQSGPLAAPQLGSCGSSGRPWWPRAARLLQLGTPRVAPGYWNPVDGLSCPS